MSKHRTSGRHCRRSRRAAACVAALLALCIVPAAQAAFRFVTNAKDSGTGSLRQAITDANTAAGTDTIVFGIPDAGVQVIRLGSALPTITDTVLISGYSQPGAMPNTLTVGDNAQILIRLDGTATTNVPGIAMCASDVIVEGLSITNFDREGIAIGRKNDNSSCPGSGYTGIEVNGNFVGLFPDGVTPGPQGFSGVLVTQSEARIGDGSAGNRNVISANLGHGVLLSVNAANTRVDNNYVGTDASGELDRGNSGAGIKLLGTGAGNFLNENAPNRIAHNQNGIEVVSSIGVLINDNEIFANDGLGIDLVATGGSFPDGVTANDIDDTDTGANNLQNFPVLASVTRTATGLSIAGSLDRPAGSGTLTYALRVYANESCDASGHGEGQRYLGIGGITISNAAENFTLSLSTTAALPVGNVISVTASDVAGNTSEFSACAVIDGGPNPFIVINTNDSGGGSLRQAILDANANPGGDTINFSIAGTGIKTISPISELPKITDPVTIDGYTQAGSTANTLAVGDNAALRIRLDGISAGASATGLTVCADDVTIRGLSITRFADAGIDLAVAPAGDPCAGVKHTARIAGNFIGLAPDGSAAGNVQYGISNRGTGATEIGGTALADRNIIAANGVGNGGAGGEASRSQIFFLNNSVNGTVVLNNYIGTDPSGDLSRAPQGDGLNFGLNGNGVTVGGARGNLIAFLRNGIVINETAHGNDISGNDIHSNTGLGIELIDSGFTPDGVTPNDLNDTDNGGNALQNHPSITTSKTEYGRLRLTGTLDVQISVSNAIYRIDAFMNASCESNGFGEGRAFLAGRNVRLSNSTESIDMDLGPAPPIGSIITLTATDPNSNTSEFSQCFVHTAGDGIYKDGFNN